MAKLHGKGGSVKIGADTLKVRSWDATTEVSTEDATETGEGFESVVVGNKKASGSFEAIYDDADPPAVNEGDEVDAEFLMKTGHSLDVPVCLITSIDYSVSATGAVTYTCNWQAQGSYTKLPAPPAGP